MPLPADTDVSTPKYLRDKYAIVGVGETTYTRGSGKTTRGGGVEEANFEERFADGAQVRRPVFDECLERGLTREKVRSGIERDPPSYPGDWETSAPVALHRSGLSPASLMTFAQRAVSLRM